MFHIRMNVTQFWNDIRDYILYHPFNHMYKKVNPAFFTKQLVLCRVISTFLAEGRGTLWRDVLSITSFFFSTAIIILKFSITSSQSFYRSYSASEFQSQLTVLPKFSAFYFSCFLQYIPEYIYTHIYKTVQLVLLISKPLSTHFLSLDQNQIQQDNPDLENI